MRVCEGQDGALALYVEGDLPSGGVVALERHLQACPRCRALLLEIEASQRALKALAAEPIPEEALLAVRARVLAETGQEAAPAPGARAWVWAGAAAAVAVLALGVMWTRPQTRRSPIARLTTDATPTPNRALRAPTIAPPDAARRDPAMSTHRRVGPVSGSEGPVAAEAVTALSPEEADQLARAVVVVARIGGLSDPRELWGDEEQARGLPGHSTGLAGLMVRWTTADPAVVIYWQFDSNGGGS